MEDKFDVSSVQEAREERGMESSMPTTGKVRAIPRGIWALGVVSPFMDTSSEMIHALLPVFLVSVLGASTTTVRPPENVLPLRFVGCALCGLEGAVPVCRIVKPRRDQGGPRPHHRQMSTLWSGHCLPSVDGLKEGIADAGTG